MISPGQNTYSKSGGRGGSGNCRKEHGKEEKMNTFAWTKDKMGMARIDAIRKFSISEEPSGYRVIAWFSDKETLDMGNFQSLKEAQDFLKGMA